WNLRRCTFFPAENKSMLACVPRPIALSVRSRTRTIPLRSEQAGAGSARPEQTTSAAHATRGGLTEESARIAAHAYRFAARRIAAELTEFLHIVKIRCGLW